MRIGRLSFRDVNLGKVMFSFSSQPEDMHCTSWNLLTKSRNAYLSNGLSISLVLTNDAL